MSSFFIFFFAVLCIFVLNPDSGLSLPLHIEFLLNFGSLVLVPLCLCHEYTYLSCVNQTGNYSCVVTPYEFAKAAHVAVHVLPNGGHTAAIQHNTQHDKRSPTGEDTPSSSGASSATSLVIFTSKSILVFLFLEVCLHHLLFPSSFLFFMMIPSVQETSCQREDVS